MALPVGGGATVVRAVVRVACIVAVGLDRRGQRGLLRSITAGERCWRPSSAEAVGPASSSALVAAHVARPVASATATSAVRLVTLQTKYEFEISLCHISVILAMFNKKKPEQDGFFFVR